MLHRCIAILVNCGYMLWYTINVDGEVSTLRICQASLRSAREGNNLGRFIRVRVNRADWAGQKCAIYAMSRYATDPLLD